MGKHQTLVLNHLAPMILMQILRVHLGSGGARPNWLTTLADPRFSKAIEAIHQHSGGAWSLDELAELSGPPWAGFASGFKKQVGRLPANTRPTGPHLRWAGLGVCLVQRRLVEGSTVRWSQDA